MEIVLYIYFAINVFLAGYWFNENDRWENRKYAIGFSLLCSVFGTLICFIYLFLLVFSPILKWVYREIQFQYRFYLTSYWDDILLDDNYSEEFRTKEDKLKRIVKIMSGFSNQTDRHIKQVQKKYGGKEK